MSGQNWHRGVKRWGKYFRETDKGESKSVDNTAADTSETVTPKNIILIMNESLTDFESVGKIKSNVEILPYIRSLNKNVKHGQLHVPTFGAGTARSEYGLLQETV